MTDNLDKKVPATPTNITQEATGEYRVEGGGVSPQPGQPTDLGTGIFVPEGEVIISGTIDFQSPTQAVPGNRALPANAGELTCDLAPGLLPKSVDFGTELRSSGAVTLTPASNSSSPTSCTGLLAWSVWRTSVAAGILCFAAMGMPVCRASCTRCSRASSSGSRRRG